ncbi:MAG: S41 family peptidase [Bacteroidota bacterium]|nr:S41 family peptidase [Bacteroidota bacterium]MDP4232079.1 S41 family peptidase [Bacteroidota bacterium]MDP4241214.1 S41 family peptidase [Bacteroidota bacterium]MDP4286606.1 S41 family peptidase [Bacteroidota bacterium]
MRQLYLALFSIVISGSSLFAQTSAIDNHPLWMRYPAISPDGNTIAFEYQGDIYTVPSAGGRATAIVTHDAYDFSPVWSPDGKSIAYASDRNGNFDVFLVPAVGGISKQLTVHTASEVPTCFTPNGDSVLFSAARMDDVHNAQFPIGVLTELYEVSTNGGMPRQILTTPAQLAQLDRGGNRILYQDRKGYENEWRKHEKASIARDIWLYDRSTNHHTKLSNFIGEDRNPVWSPDENEVYYLSEKSGSLNIWKLPIAHPEQTTQVTSFEKNPIRFLSIARTGTMAFGFNGEIYTLPAGGTTPTKVSIEIMPTEKSNSTNFSTLTSGATEFAVSPNGKEFAFVIRGDIFVASMDYDVTKRITNTPEQERSVSFSPDGRSLLYASERGHSWKIFETTIEHKEEPYFYASTTLKETPVIATERECFQPHYSPDGKEVAYLEERTNLKVINLKTHAIRTIMDSTHNYSYTDGDQWYEWSPDGKWFLVQFIDHNRWSNEVGLIDAQGKGSITNLTNSGYDDTHPTWSKDGTMIYWFSDRQGLRSHGNNSGETDVFGMFLTQAAWDRFRMTREEFDLARLAEKDTKDSADNKAGKKKESKDSLEKKKVLAPITIDLKNIEDRMARLTINSSRMSDAVLSHDGERLYYITSYPKGGALWVHIFRDGETKMLTKLAAAGGQLVMDDAGKELYLLNNGNITKIDTANGSEKHVGYKAGMELNSPEERAYMFEHVWRQVLKKFYVENLNGVDWTYYKAAYSRFLPYINNNYDFAEMLSELLGELNASHTGSGYRPPNPEQNATASLGAFFDQNYTGNGIRIQEIIERGPLDVSASKTRAGTIIRAIDDQKITPAVDFNLYLNRKAGKPTRLALYNPEKDSSWEEIVKPVSRDEEGELLYQRWIKSRRLEVDSLSHGTIGYVHVRSMGDDSYRHAYSEILGRENDKSAMIVDTRFNGGGWLHDELATLLSGKEYVKFFPRHQDLGGEPTEKWSKPSVVLISESNYSDAHFFPYTYRALGIGKLVGMPVPGTATAVWWETLQDNTLYFGIPQVGVLDMQGKYLEGQELEPDYLVNNDPESVAKGRDLQLEKAVEVLMKKE